MLNYTFLPCAVLITVTKKANETFKMLKITCFVLPKMPVVAVNGGLNLLTEVGGTLYFVMNPRYGLVTLAKWISDN